MVDDNQLPTEEAEALAPLPDDEHNVGSASADSDSPNPDAHRGLAPQHDGAGGSSGLSEAADTGETADTTAEPQEALELDATRDDASDTDEPLLATADTDTGAADEGLGAVEGSEPTGNGDNADASTALNEHQVDGEGGDEPHNAPGNEPDTDRYDEPTAVECGPQATTDTHHEPTPDEASDGATCEPGEQPAAVEYGPQPTTDTPGPTPDEADQQTACEPGDDTPHEPTEDEAGDELGEYERGNAASKPPSDFEPSDDGPEGSLSNAARERAPGPVEESTAGGTPIGRGSSATAVLDPAAAAQETEGPSAWQSASGQAHVGDTPRGHQQATYAGSPTPGASAPQPGPPPGPRRLYRSRHDQVLGGVGAGVAEHLRVDPTIVRLGFLALALTGVGLLVYLAAWILMPVRPDGAHVSMPPGPQPPTSDRTMLRALGLAAIAVALGITVGSWEVLAIALLVSGVWLLSERTPADPTVPFAGPSAPPGPNHPYATQPANFAPTSSPPAGPSTSSPTPTVPSPTSPIPAGQSAAPTPQYSAYEPPPPPPTYDPPTSPRPAEPPQKRSREPQYISRIVLSLLGLLAAVGIAAEVGDWWDVRALRLASIGLAIIAIGIVAGQIRRGGARGLIPLALLVALTLVPLRAIDSYAAGIGSATYRPLTFEELDSSYSLGIGELVVDLSALDFGDREDRIDVRLGMGEVRVILPAELGGTAEVRAGAGEITYRTTRSASGLGEGLNVSSETIVLGGDEGNVDINVRVGLGTADLSSAP